MVCKETTFSGYFKINISCLNRFWYFFCSKYTRLKFLSSWSNDHLIDVNRSGATPCLTGRFRLLSINLSINVLFSFHLVVGIWFIFSSVDIWELKPFLKEKPFLKNLMAHRWLIFFTIDFHLSGPHDDSFIES
jgi:hypothetical protein